MSFQPTKSVPVEIKGWVYWNPHLHPTNHGKVTRPHFHRWRWFMLWLWCLHCTLSSRCPHPRRIVSDRWWTKMYTLWTMYSILSSFCIGDCTWGICVKILIIGAGLTGLSCARELHKQGHDITIVESRAEIGYPQDKPSLITGETDLSNFAPFIHLTDTGCRRPWLAKSMAQHLPITYILRTQASTLT